MRICFLSINRFISTTALFYYIDIFNRQELRWIFYNKNPTFNERISL